MLEEGLERHRAGDLDGAVAKYREALERDPDNHEAIHLMALLEQDRGRLEAALDWADKAVLRRPDMAGFRMTRGILRERRGDRRGALEDLRAAVEANPNLPGANLNLGYLEWRAGNLEAAERALRDALKSEPDDARALTNLGHVLMEQNRTDQAVRTLQDAAELAPRSAPTQLALGLAFLARGSAAFAEQCFDNAHALQPENPRPRALKARAMAAQDRVKEARELLESMLTDAPDDVDAMIALGDIELSAGQAGAAVNRYQYALSLDRDRPRLLARLGDAYRRYGDEDAARKCYAQAISEGDDRADVHASFGDVLKGLQLLDDAEGAYRRALRTEAGHATAALALAKLLLSRGDLEEADRTVAAALRAGAESAEFDLTRGEVAFCRGRHDEAATIAASRLDDDPQRFAPLLARARYASADLPGALDVPRRAARGGSGPRGAVPDVSQWSLRPPDDGRAATLLITGQDRGGYEDWAPAISAHPHCRVLLPAVAPRDRTDLFAPGADLGDPNRLSESAWRLQRRRYWRGVLRRLEATPQPELRIIDPLPLDETAFARARRYFPGSIVLLCVRHPRAMYLDARLTALAHDESLALALAASRWLAWLRGLDLNVVRLRHEEAARQLTAEGTFWDHLGLAGADVYPAFADAQASRRGLASYPELDGKAATIIPEDAAAALTEAADSLGY